MSDSDTQVPVNILGLVARWRSGTFRDQQLPGVPWTAGEIGDALAPIMRGKDSSHDAVDSLATKALNDPCFLNADEIRQLASAVLSRTPK